MQYKILMVDDNLKNIKATKGFLEASGFEVTAVSDSEAAISLVKKDEFALALLDFQMPEISGDTLASMIREVNPLQQVAMFSCDTSREALKQSYRAGVVDFIEKSEDPNEMLKRVQMYCNRYETVLRTVRPAKDKNENRKLLEQFKIVGQSEVMGKVGLKIQKFAEAGDVTVLIHGESGTGKELVAQALHDHSPRAKNPFVAINCAAIPKDLLESTLFGHKQGAFTGAVANQDGKFVQADKGTIFLDEIGDLSLDLQAKLLRVLQERVVEPLGSRLPRKVDVRIICASHKKIEDLVKQGLFREDLMYRIKVVDLELPPLRERTEDIYLLVAHFTEVYNEKYKSSRFFQKRAIDVLKKYSWPGNVRELAGVVERHLIQATGPLVKPEDLDLKLYSTEEISLVNENLKLSEWEEQQGKAKISFILETIEAAGSKVEAARRLGVSPSHLQYLLNQSKAAKLKQET
ncbi:MAG: sigma-54-dependent Fis family transcriptional regulator [Bdellovibrionaceae bacterium]|nr:sigma-54-dependent Fis family transcriptional regulator [Pseudobdellovibrionaceae bacterium]